MEVNHSPRLRPLLNSTSSLDSIPSLNSISSSASSSSAPSPTSATPSASINWLTNNDLLLPTLSFHGAPGTESDSEEMSSSDQHMEGLAIDTALSFNQSDIGSSIGTAGNLNTDHKAEELEQRLNGASYLSLIKKSVNGITAQLPRLEPKDWSLSLSVCVISVLYQIYTARALERKYEIEFEQMLNKLLRQTEQAMNSPLEKKDSIFAEMDSMRNQFNRIVEHLNQPGQQGLYLAFGALMMSISGMAILWRKVSSQAEQLDRQTERLNNQAKQLDRQTEQLNNQLRQLDGKSAQLNNQEGSIRKLEDGYAELTKESAIQKLWIHCEKKLKDGKKDHLEVYVKPQGMLVDGVGRFDLEEKVNGFFESDKKVLLVLGESGAGKSTFSGALAHRLWESYKTAKDSQNALFPLFIQLTDLRDLDRDLIEQYLKSQRFSEDQIKALQESQRFVLIVDGGDGVIQGSESSKVGSWLEKWDAKVLISMRPEVVAGADHYQGQFYPSGEAGLFEKCRLAPFSEEYIDKYIEQYARQAETGRNAEKSKSAFRDVEGLKELVSNFLTLKIALQALSEIDVSSLNLGQARIALYDKLIEEELKAGIRDEMGALSWMNRLNLVKDQEVLRFLSDRAKREEPLKENLLRIVNLSKERAEFARGAANALTVLVRAGVQFNGSDLKGIRIPGADLSQGVFDSAQLENADLSGVNLRSSWLRGANLSGAQMSGVQFGEWPYLQEESEVLFCAYSPDGKACAIGLFNGNISVYGTSDWEKMHTLEGHTGWVNSVAYSPSGDHLASGSWDNTVRVWSAASGAVVHILEGHTGGVNSVVYSPRGDHLASESSDKTVRVWSAASGAVVHALEGHTGKVNSVVYSPRGDHLASGSSDKTVRVWSAASGAVVYTLEGHTGKVNSVVYSPRGDYLASGSSDKTVRMWSAASGAVVYILEGHTCSVTSVVYSPRGDHLASGSSDKTVRVWSAASGAVVHTLEGHEDSITSVVYSLREDHLASGSDDGTVRVWSAASGAFIHTLEGHTDGVSSVVYSPRGDQLASGSWDKTARVWSAASGAFVHTLEGHTNSVNSVVYSPSGAQIASGSRDKTVRLWDAQTGAAVRTLERHIASVNSVVYSPSGSQLASGSFDKTVRLWDAQTGVIVYTLEGHTASVNSVAYSPSGAQLASGSEDKTVRLWDAQAGTLRHTLAGHEGSVRSAAYSPNGEQIASGSEDKTVRLWDAQTGVTVHTLEGHNSWVSSVVYSPSGAQIASGSFDTMVRLWDTQTGMTMRTLKGHTASVSSVAYSPSGIELASGGYDCTVRVWEVESGDCLMVIQGFTQVVNSVAWKWWQNVAYLLSGSRDNSVREWEVKKDEGVYKAMLCWSSGHEVLTVRDTLLERVVGLSEMNSKLLKQKGAVLA